MSMNQRIVNALMSYISLCQPSCAKHIQHNLIIIGWARLGPNEGPTQILGDVAWALLTEAQPAGRWVGLSLVYSIPPPATYCTSSQLASSLFSLISSDRSSIRFSSSLFFSFSKLLNYHLSTIDPTNRSFASRFTCIWFNCHFFSLQLKDDIHHVCYNSLGLR